MNKYVTWFFVASGVAFVVLGVLSLFIGQYLIALLLIGSGGADVFMAMRRKKNAAEKPKPSELATRPPRPRPTPVQVPEASALRAIPEPVTVCPDCGFLAISAGRGGGTYIGGGQLLSSCHCPRCGYDGLPIRFDKRSDYEAFVKVLHEDNAHSNIGPG